MASHLLLHGLLREHGGEEHEHHRLDDAVEHIDVLGFHQLGRPKWHELRIPYPLENQKGPNAATRERVTNQFKDHGFTVY